MLPGSSVSWYVERCWKMLKGASSLSLSEWSSWSQTMWHYLIMQHAEILNASARVSMSVDGLHIGLPWFVLWFTHVLHLFFPCSAISDIRWYKPVYACLCVRGPCGSQVVCVVILSVFSISMVGSSALASEPVAAAEGREQNPLGLTLTDAKTAKISGFQ